MKRHAGYGPLGTGGIYVTNVAAGTTTSFVNLASLGILTGANTHSGLVGDKTLPSTDSLSFAQVGKVSFGDMDISDDGKYLFVVNLNTRQVHKIFINNPAVVPTAANVTSYAIPNPCGNTDYRPFGLKYRNGKLYVAVTCTGETSQSGVDMSGNVYVMDATTGVFGSSPVLSFPLDYTRGYAWSGTPASNQFYPWLKDWTKILVDAPSAVITYPQAMLSDIEFDLDGSMILGVRDRFGDQMGVFNNYPDGTNPNLEVVTGGDILRAYPGGASGGWIIESGGKSGALSSGVANGQGFGGSEFYKADYYNGGLSYGHQETSDGGLALLPGSGQVIMTAFDARDSTAGSAGFNAGGVRTLNNKDGSFANGYEVYNSGGYRSGTFEKSGGLGDIEVLCNAQPLEIGNYVWFDSIPNGVQDPCESPLAGVNVKLLDSLGVTLATTVTNAVGQYYFKDSTNVLQTWVTGGATGSKKSLQPNTKYYVVVGMGQASKDTLTNGGKKYLPTLYQIGAGTNPKYNDSDGKLGTAGDPSAVLNMVFTTAVTGAAGSSDHTFDFGFKCLPPTETVSSTNVKCFGGADGTATITASGGSSPYSYKWSNAATTAVVTGLAAGKYYFTLTDAGGCNVKDSVTIGQPAVAMSAMASAGVCNNHGTPATGSDDTFTFSVTVSGTGTSWKANDAAGTTGSYGVARLFGPYLISAGGVTLTFTDVPSGCVYVMPSSVAAPAPCSSCPAGDCLPVTVVRH